MLRIIFLCAIFAASTVLGQVVNKEITRTIDATTAIVKITAEIKAVNVKGEYQLAFPTDEAKCISFLTVSLEQKGGKGKQLPVSAPVRYKLLFLLILEYIFLTSLFSLRSQGNATIYNVMLSKDGGASVTLKLTAVLTSFLEPFPAEITQAESQLVRLTESHVFYSPYATETQKTTIRLASRTIESYSKHAPHSLVRDVLTYGPYKNTPGNTLLPATVHFVNNRPFAKLSNVNREIEVSHWGNVAIEETYELKHAGAKLSGGFSRFDYKGGRTGGDSPSFRSIFATLPSQANSIYYRDQIGNISTSDLKKVDGGIEMEIQTRFPMFGGWQTQFYIGYSVPTETMLFVDAATGRHNLKFDFFTIFDDVWVEDMEIKVVLPEGCSDIKMDIPYTVETAWTQRFTYLDSIFNGGRKVLTIKTKNLVKEHSKKVTISYSFSRVRMLFEPLLLCVTFFLFFCGCSFVSRVNTIILPAAESFKPAPVAATTKPQLTTTPTVGTGKKAEVTAAGSETETQE